ncbi:acylphosphatase [Lichenifustis flavocetrariae]|uniref:acylphosphatase n=1 Tax=Lichenifustis flavocetrariae TaxID=2949735 RepID=A0AA41YSH2_9HYPH|nr:acylphosphatase [Lichenifustis flavocetrariae]MCW6507754.1 acylphosphatase [Lichenifustis flavocetrariae]
MALHGQNGRAEAKSQEAVAISATVTGNDQGVGFRAMVMKQAIAYNLAGTAKNDANNIVEFTLQGHQKRIDKAVETIRSGTRKSSGIEIETTPIAADPKLNTFTVIDWTSTSRQITTPYTLIFRLRGTDETISQPEAKHIWHEILKLTVKGDDLKKLGDE